jgi:prepilin-type N-terminal cleavage/methylation domain-containing protein
MYDRERGFTLIEAVVALAIAALMLGALQQGLASGWKGVRLASLEQMAIQHARARLASAGIETPFTEGEQSGTEANGIGWTTRIRRYVSGSGTPPPLPAYWVSVEVRWKDVIPSRARSLSLVTLKLGGGRP